MIVLYLVVLGPKTGTSNLTLVSSVLLLTESDEFDVGLGSDLGSVAIASL